MLFIVFWAIAGGGGGGGATLRCGVPASHCSGFSCCRAQALGLIDSVVVARGVSNCNPPA